jgi:hypothetical protein
VLGAVGREPPLRENLNAEAEGLPLLESVTRERMVKTQQAEKFLACAVVVYKVWRSPMEL